MRKVKFKKWIPQEYIQEEAKFHKSLVQGTGKYEPDFLSEGLFHSWGLDSDDGASYTVAIVECENGSVHLVSTSNILFTQPI